MKGQYIFFILNNLYIHNFLLMRSFITLYDHTIHSLKSKKHNFLDSNFKFAVHVNNYYKMTYVNLILGFNEVFNFLNELLVCYNLMYQALLKRMLEYIELKQHKQATFRKQAHEQKLDYNVAYIVMIIELDSNNDSFY